MIFHYVNGALMCEVKIRGLTWVLPTYNELSEAFYRDKDEHWYFGDEYYYGGFKYFVAESLGRRAAQIIVDALGGYLVPEFVPPSRWLGDGGPFYIHGFTVENAWYIMSMERLEQALDSVHAFVAEAPSDVRYRVYDKSGFMVAEFRGGIRD